MTKEVLEEDRIAYFPSVSLDEQATLAEKYEVETLLFCPDPWAQSIHSS